MKNNKIRCTVWAISIILFLFPISAIFAYAIDWLDISDFLPASLEDVYGLFVHASLPIAVVLVSYFRLNPDSPKKFGTNKHVVLVFALSLMCLYIFFILPHSIVSRTLPIFKPPESSWGQNYKSKALDYPHPSGKHIAGGAYLYDGEIIHYRTEDGEIVPFVPSQSDYQARQNLLQLKYLLMSRSERLPWIVFVHLISIGSIVLNWKRNAGITDREKSANQGMNADK